jgi:hypothetical protein
MNMTLAEMADTFEPTLTRVQARTLMVIAGIEPCGTRRTGRAGRPAMVYDADAARRAHAQEAARTTKQFTDNDWIGSALLDRKLIRADADAGEVWWAYGHRAETLMHDFYGYVLVGPQRCAAHRIIWISAEGQIPPCQQVNHRNQLRWDNRRANLELVSFGNNIRHAHGKPYLTYHQAVSQLQMLPPSIPRAVPEVAGMARVAGVFRPDW